MSAFALRLNRFRNVLALLARQPGLSATIILTLAALVVFCLYPILRVLLATVFVDGSWDFSVVAETFSSRAFLVALRNSVWLGCVSAFAATCIGFVFAYAVARVRIPARRFFHIMAMLPILSPPFVISLAVILLFGRNGVVTNTLLGIRNNNVYGFTSLAVVQTLALFPLAYLNLRGLLEAIDPALEDSARSLGASRRQAFLHVTLPLCLPGVLSSLLIVFAKSISDFGNPQILAGDYSVLSVQAYLQINGMYDLRTGSFMAVSILLPTMLAFVIQKYWVARKSFVTVTGKPSGAAHPIEDRRVVLPFTLFCLFITLTIVLFYGTVIWVAFVRTWGVNMSLTLRNFSFVLQHGIDAVTDTLILSVVATPITALLGMAIAFLLIRKNFPGKRLMAFSAMLPFAVPGIALGIGYVLSFNAPPLNLTGTAAIIVAALVARNLSVGIEAGANSLRQIDPVIEEASAVLGADSLTTFRHISLPLMRAALFTGLLNAFVRSMTSVSAVVFLVSVNWNLLTVSILSEIESSRLGAASAYCVVLMAIVAAAFCVLELLVNRIGKGDT